MTLAKNKVSFLNLAKSILLLLLLTVAAWHCYQAIQQIRELKTYRAELSEISHIRYGLLNADAWVKIISDIIEKKIDAFELNKANRKGIQQSVERIMDQMIVELDNILRRRNNECDGFFDCLAGGSKQIVTDVLIDVKSLREHVPEFTEIALDEFNTPATKKRIKKFLLQKLQVLSANTFTKTDMSAYDAILTKHKCLQKTACTKHLHKHITLLNNNIAHSAIIVIAAIIGIYVTVILLKPIGGFELIILICSCLMLLVVGIGTPMIEIEAKIDSLSFQLLNEPVVFGNQLLYFQNKSILDIISVLLKSKQLETTATAILIFLFSIIFPILKLFCSVLYFYNFQHNNVIKFFALKSGKWSMADVMVVAFFMAYLGFNGLISSQLSSLAEAAKHVEVLTTNGTSLQIGFFMFLTFCLASLVLSSLIESLASSAQSRLKATHST